MSYAIEFGNDYFIELIFRMSSTIQESCEIVKWLQRGCETGVLAAQALQVVARRLQRGSPALMHFWFPYELLTVYIAFVGSYFVGFALCRKVT
jgi:hypothetical protein